jgi:hypothetical protein
MSEVIDVELDERLSELERDLGPTMRNAYRTKAIRADFASEVRARMFHTESRTRPPRPVLRILPQRVWPTLAATLVGVLVVGAVFVNRAQPASAADVLDQLQTEAFGAMIEGEGPCPGMGAPHGAGSTLVIGSGGTAAGPVTVSNAGDPNELSERLAKALGVSGDRVRQAMIATLRADPAAPPEPISTIAQQLDKTPSEVCAALFDPQSAGGDHLVVSASTQAGTGRPGPRMEAVFNVGGKAINLNSASADDVSAPAQRLGVTPERLLTAMRATLPSTPPPPPPSEDEIIKRLAGNLGLSEDQVRAAIKQVRGNAPFFFVVPLPGAGG